VAPDLPAHGIDRTPVNRVSLRSYTERICRLLDKEDEPAILLGHSMGGIVITQAAEYRPDRIAKLVYLAAFLLPGGRSLHDEVQSHHDSRLTPNMVFDENDPSYVDIRPEAAREVFYGDCSGEDVTLALSLLTPQPQSPLMAPMQTTEENFSRVPRVYIEALQDRVLTSDVQKRMHTELPCEQVITMDTSHSPFFSQPQALAEHLLSLV